MNKHEVIQYGIMSLFFFIVGTNEVFIVDGNSFYQGLAVIFGVVFLLVLLHEHLNNQNE